VRPKDGFLIRCGSAILLWAQANCDNVGLVEENKN
jgi:hypothetical protein